MVGWKKGRNSQILEEGKSLKLVKVEPKQHFTQPPPRFTEASLIRELEEKGIGRPSTYASIMQVIQKKGIYHQGKETIQANRAGDAGE